MQMVGCHNIKTNIKKIQPLHAEHGRLLGIIFSVYNVTKLFRVLYTMYTKPIIL